MLFWLQIDEQIKFKMRTLAYHEAGIHSID